MKHEGRKIGRNDPCPCGSGKKYKKCCMNAKTPKPVNYKKLYADKYNIRLKSQNDIEQIRTCGRLVLESLDLVEAAIAPGVTTDQLNTIAHEHAVQNGAVPAPLNYRGFPKSICTSVNEVICHGIPGNYALKNGDIVNVDVTHCLNGFYADCNKTFFVGDPSPEAKKIVSVAAQSLKAAMEMLAPGNYIGDIGWAIQRYAEGENCSVVREFVGHGVGFEFHEPPQVPHYGKKGTGIMLVPNMVFTVEPMINLGGPELFIADDQWTAITADRKLSAQFEQSFVITEEGFESLTPFDL
ncbi:MAG TPA: methionyl aminopeptidase [Desulfosalsimonadaceae bacterium]|nr:methionyl aminopeptidase [Desulfosalsimonadaceae bacterium]